jgi:hypothetical protein
LESLGNLLTMAKYAVKCTVWLQIDSDYADGIGEAQHEVEYIIDRIKYGNDERHITIARATDIEIRPPGLYEKSGECTDQLYYDEICLDNGIR